MRRYKHILSLDLSSYGAALAITNQFADDELVKVFELSPCGSAGVLILLTEELHSLQVIAAEIRSMFKSDVIESRLVENVHDDLLPVYLSQNKVVLGSALAVYETDSVSLALEFANSLLKENVQLVDFRVVRTYPKNVILTLTSENAATLSQVSPRFKRTLIEKLQPSVRNFYEIR